MKMSHDDTKSFIFLVLGSDALSARHLLHDRLVSQGRAEGEFYDGIITHAPFMNLTDEQWFDLLSKLPLRALRAQLNLRGLLSESQIAKLPPTSG